MPIVALVYKPPTRYNKVIAYMSSNQQRDAALPINTNGYANLILEHEDCAAEFEALRHRPGHSKSQEFELRTVTFTGGGGVHCGRKKCRDCTPTVSLRNLLPHHHATTSSSPARRYSTISRTDLRDLEGGGVAGEQLLSVPRARRCCGLRQASSAAEMMVKERRNSPDQPFNHCDDNVNNNNLPNHQPSRPLARDSVIFQLQIPDIKIHPTTPRHVRRDRPESLGQRLGALDNIRWASHSRSLASSSCDLTTSAPTTPLTLAPKAKLRTRNYSESNAGIGGVIEGGRLKKSLMSIRSLETVRSCCQSVRSSHSCLDLGNLEEQQVDTAQNRSWSLQESLLNNGHVFTGFGDARRFSNYSLISESSLGFLSVS